jgi:hypothetical protein
MSHTDDGKTVVRVEVEVGAGKPKVTVDNIVVYESQRFVPRPLTASFSIPVCFNGTTGFINWSGDSPVMNSQYAGSIQAIVVPGAVDPTLKTYATPLTGAVTGQMGLSGSYSFDQSLGNPIPGAQCGSGSAGANTLLVWFNFGGSPTLYAIEATQFRGKCVGSCGSGGSGGSLSGSAVQIGDMEHPHTLVATFTGALACLGTIKLAWNGVSWIGESSSGGGTIISFQCHKKTYQLLACGPGASFVLAEEPLKDHPFMWSASGKSIGTHAGTFKVTILE